MEQIVIYSDGACAGNPGPGGWAYIIEHPKEGIKKSSGYDPQTTNNRMEMIGVLEALKVLQPGSTVKLITDSTYVIDGLRKWINNWKRNGWKTYSGEPVKNKDLWLELDKLSSRHIMTIEHVRGHSGIPQNEECDRMAVKAYKEKL